MCFTEYLGYTCGHCSVAVNRPCPMTTHLFNNPCCPKPANRPYLAGTMCYPCSRIIHGRKIDIAEYEHRWMHERGACGCEVQFPAMQEPKLVQRTWHGDRNDNGAYTSAPTARAGPSTSYAGPSTACAGPSTAYAGPSNQQAPPMPCRGQGTGVPLFEEARVGGNVEVAVRLSSLYAAEWTEDHAKLHESGQCQCPVSFERYKPIDINEYEDENNHPGKGKGKEKAKEPAHNPQDHLSGRTAAGHPARYVMDGPQESLLDEILGPIHPQAPAYDEHPADIQTMYFQPTGAPIAGTPIAWGPTPESSGLPTIVEFTHPETTHGGFPIGAGPEGESHAGDFDNCSLNLAAFKDTPVIRRCISTEF
ncbi:hypothetical protein GGR51DRAFT_578255 [Nemania sp. FL0031]|nr:hypothetical protein GGR51DRAFT_578255 [Nemania sp. FL0031]